MYGNVLGVANVATGISLLPNTGSSKALFVVATSFIVAGVVIMIVSAIMTRRSQKQSQDA